MLFKCDYMFSVISKDVQYECNSVHQRRNTLKNADNGKKNSGNPINKKDPMDFFHISLDRYSKHEQQQHLYKIFGNSKRIIVYLGGTGEIQWKVQKQVLTQTKTQKRDSSHTIIINKHEKGVCNYTMNILFASLQLYCVIYV